MSVTIAEFLEARIAEDEAGAYAHSGRDRVMADCAAKREILSDYIAASHAESWWSQDAIKTNAAFASAWELTLRHLAAIYSHHPDCRQEWVK